MSITSPGYGQYYDPYAYMDPYYAPQYSGQQRSLGLGQSSHSSLDSLAALSPLGGGQVAQPPKKKKGLFGKITGAVKSLAKGATVNVVKGILSPKGLLTAAAGIGLALAFPPAAPVLLAVGAGMALKGGVESGVAAAQLYAAGEDELAEKALEGVGSSVTGLALSAVGAKSMAKAGGVPKTFETKGLISKNAKTVSLADDAGATQSLIHGFRYSNHLIRNGGRNAYASFKNGSIVADARTLGQTGINNLSTTARALTGRQGVTLADDAAATTADDAAAASVADDAVNAADDGVTTNPSVTDRAKGLVDDVRSRFGGDDVIQFADDAGVTAVSSKGQVNLGASSDDLIAAYNALDDAAAQSGTNQLAVTQIRSTIQSELRQRGFKVKADGSFTNPRTSTLNKRSDANATQAQDVARNNADNNFVNFNSADDVNAIGLNQSARAVQRDVLKNATPEELTARVDALKTQAKDAGRFEQVRINAEVRVLESRIKGLNEGTIEAGAPINRFDNPFFNTLGDSASGFNTIRPGVAPLLPAFSANNYNALQEEIRRMYGQGGF